MLLVRMPFTCTGAVSLSVSTRAAKLRISTHGSPTTTTWTKYPSRSSTMSKRKSYGSKFRRLGWTQRFTRSSSSATATRLGLLHAEGRHKVLGLISFTHQATLTAGMILDQQVLIPLMDGVDRVATAAQQVLYSSQQFMMMTAQPHPNHRP